MTGVDGAGRQKGPVAKMTNMRISMLDFSSWLRITNQLLQCFLSAAAIQTQHRRPCCSQLVTLSAVRFPHWWHLLQQTDDRGSACDGLPVTSMAYGPGKPYDRGCNRLLSSFAATVLCVHLHVHCQPESTVVVHDSSELASALRNASIASQATPGTTTVQLTLYSWEVSIDMVFPTVSVPC